jgi:hypothetical protein
LRKFLKRLRKTKTKMRNNDQMIKALKRKPKKMKPKKN